MVKIILIFPPLSMKERYGTDVADVGGHHPPLGLLWMAAVLEQDGHEVKVLDCPVNKYSPDDVMRIVDEFKPDMVGLATITMMLERTKEMTLRLKEKYPSLFILIGGPHVKVMPQESLTETQANVALVGEAETSIRKIANNLDAYRTPQIVIGEKVEDLNALPMPARHLVDMSKYFDLPNTYKKYPNTISVITSRGCPYTCTFCADALGKFRQRSIDKVIEELKFVCETYNTKEISFWDDVFTMNKRWMMEFCKRVQDEKIDILWSCLTRLNLLDEELLAEMKKAGCWNILVGIESGNQDILDNVKKQMTLDTIREKVKIVKNSGIELRASFVLGLPLENPQKAMNTINFAIELDPDYVQFCLCAPFPGTEIWTNAEKWGKINRNFKGYSGWEPVFVPYGYKDAAELKKMHTKAFRKFYLRPKYVWKRITKIRSFDEAFRQVKGLKTVMGFV